MEPTKDEKKNLDDTTDLEAILADPKKCATLGKYPFPVEVLDLDSQPLASGGLDRGDTPQGIFWPSEPNTLDTSNTYEVILRMETGDRRATLKVWNDGLLNDWQYWVVTK